MCLMTTFGQSRDMKGYILKVFPVVDRSEMVDVFSEKDQEIIIIYADKSIEELSRNPDNTVKIYYLGEVREMPINFIESDIPFEWMEERIIHKFAPSYHNKPLVK